jgi:signal transduction histidine kinase
MNSSESTDNLLNQNLMRAVKEKNEFLDRLISSNRALGISALANSIAHQFSQPLTGIILQTESVKRDLTQSKSHPHSVEALNTVTDELGKLSLLVNNLSRLFGGKERDFKALSAQVLCNGILDIIEPTLVSKQITLTKHYQSNPIIFSNGTQIQQVLINVFNNAIDAIVSKNSLQREIDLTITEGNGYGKLIIQDTGGGINPEMLPVLFELYQSSKEDGLGIGLWLSKEIMEQHKGTISARNDPQGGAVFEIAIPLAADIKEATKE